MSNDRNYVFVLWGEQFDELAAAVFVTELRELGLRVKIVGLTMRPVNGARGLALLPDLSLEEALQLADLAQCVVVPYPGDRCHHLKNDSCLSKFLEQSAANQCCFVVGPPANATIVNLFPPTDRGTTTYPTADKLVHFARSVGASLLEEMNPAT